MFENSVFTFSLKQSLKFLMAMISQAKHAKSRPKLTASNRKKIPMGKDDIYIT